MARVLAIETDEAVRRLIAVTLGTAGHEVDVEATLLLAVLKSAAAHFDLVIMNASAANHLEQARLAKELRTHWPVPIILTSGAAHAVSGFVERDGFVLVTKPFKRCDLLGAVDRALRR